MAHLSHDKPVFQIIKGLAFLDRAWVFDEFHVELVEVSFDVDALIVRIPVIID